MFCFEKLNGFLKLDLHLLRSIKFVHLVPEVFYPCDRMICLEKQKLYEYVLQFMLGG